MTVKRVQAFLLQQLGASASVRRRFVPPSQPAPVLHSQNQRWRERPRRRARHLTPERPDGVVHAIVGRVPCPCLGAQFVQENRAACVRVFVYSCEARSGRRLASLSVRAWARFFDGTGLDHAHESGNATIARMMLAPCSAS
jgi:hypothetical protein